MFKRRKVSLLGFEQPLPETEAKLYPVRESERLNETVAILDTLQEGFLNECIQKGLTAEEASEAMLAAMQEGAYPTALSTRPRRDNVRVVHIIHGTPPRELLEVTEGNNQFYVRLGEKSDGSNWQTEPDTDDPESFFVKSHNIEPHDRVPHYGDERDQRNAKAFRGLSTQLLAKLQTYERN